MNNQRNNLMAGIFVMVGVILTAAVIVVLSDAGHWFTPTQPITVRIPLSDGVQGLKDGAQVAVGGQPVGSVVQIDDVPDEETGVVRWKDVTFTIPANYTVYENARIELIVPPLGSGAKLNIASFGADLKATVGFSGASWRYEPGDKPIGFNVAPSQFASDFVEAMGVEELQKQQLRNIIANIERITDALGSEKRPLEQVVQNITTITGALADKAPQMSADLAGTLSDARAFAADVRQRQPGWMDGIDRIKDAAATALDRVNMVLDENRPVIRDAVAAVNAILQENRPVIRDALADVKQITGKARAEMLGKIDSALDTAAKAIEDVKQVTGDLRTFVAAERPTLERTLANARIVSDQLKLAAIEIRRSPWRLMYTPGDKELETDNIYDASRSFAEAAGTLDSAADSLRAVLDRHGGQVDAADPDVKHILEALHRSFEQFIEAEKLFWNELEKRRDR